MEPNIFKIKVGGATYNLRIIPLMKSDKKWSFQIEDLPPASRFTVEQNNDETWIQASGPDKIDQNIIDEIGSTIRTQYL